MNLRLMISSHTLSAMYITHLYNKNPILVDIFISKQPLISPYERDVRISTFDKYISMHTISKPMI